MTLFSRTKIPKSVSDYAQNHLFRMILTIYAFLNCCSVKIKVLIPDVHRGTVTMEAFITSHLLIVTLPFIKLPFNYICKVHSPDQRSVSGTN